ncbi:hypothetical protein RQM47_06395 [Rubrivirga sp. S365]|uniref:Uncharacterized protein n=1 Tax=Rubrivirga litoralis TaxID=3075598 RepID=A0ABU3BN10_9BACT|nr:MULTISPECIES: hypothetical protein [unclassified Rubrivirga]MDT0630690.1 hypothetical protein [Rubrivirga sp. F394]MDT7856262.1 hypothetical protein [Rubrivirga sp. S365]
MLRRLSLLAALVLTLGACDSNDVDDTALEVFVTDLRFDARTFDPSPDGLRATFYGGNAQTSGDALGDALATAGDGDLVMLYIDVELVSLTGGAENGTWAALPLTRGFNDIVFGDTNDDDVSDGDILATTLLASYEYSFDNGNLYFDVVSSIPSSRFADPNALFNLILPQRVEDGPDQIDLRLVVIPDELFFTNQAAARVDLRDYEAVQAAFGLPD